jgi:hypothetical protein
MRGAAMTEAQLQNCVRDCALLFGWKFYHPWISVRSAGGYPDCTLVRGERLIFAELKSDRGKLSEAQRDWLDALGAVPGVETFVFYPSDWLSGRIEEVLR